MPAFSRGTAWLLPVEPHRPPRLRVVHEVRLRPARPATHVPRPTSRTRPKKRAGTASSSGSRSGASMPGCRSRRRPCARSESASARCSRRFRGCVRGSWRARRATLDNLSGGRVQLAVGLGATDTGFDEFGEVTDRRTRAELLDEGLDVLTGLWRGQPFAYDGEALPPPPDDVPRAAASRATATHSHLGRRRMAAPELDARALRYDGIIPSARGEDGTCAGEHRRSAPDPAPIVTDTPRSRRPLRHHRRRHDLGIESHSCDGCRRPVGGRRCNVVDRGDVGG